MADVKLVQPPGIVSQFTQTLAKGRYWDSNRIRWMNGLPQKLGGWTRMTSTPLVGTCRGMHAWASLDGTPYLACGTDQRLQLFEGGLIYDITPLRDTANIPPDFSTVISTPTVTIVDAAHGGSIGDWVLIYVPVSVGGLVIQGYYQIVTVPGANSYTITAASNATSTVNNGGAVPSFGTTMGSASINVTLANHGYSALGVFTVQVSTTVATIVISGDYTVQSVTNANVFVITGGSLASATTSGSENAGNARLEYLIPSGYAVNTPLDGYGVGDYGAGEYGLAGSGGLIGYLREWFLDNWGENLIGNYTRSTLYEWTPPYTAENRALPVANAPDEISVSFVAMPEQIVVAAGAETAAVFDPLLVRWSDVADNTVWVASSTNQAGSFRLPNGSKIVAAAQVGNQGLIWTDVDLWSMQYQGPPFIFSFNRVGSACGALAARSIGIYGDVAIWPSDDAFFVFDGQRTRPIECPVRDYFFTDLNTDQLGQINAGVNSLFTEISWFFLRDVVRYVKVNMLDPQNLWDVGVLTRTAFIDHSPVGNPIGTDENNRLQEHETGADDDGNAMNEYIQTGYMDIAEGEDYPTVKRLLPDQVLDATGAFIELPTLQYTVYAVNYAGDPPRQKGPFVVDEQTSYRIVKSRGRMVSAKVGFSSLGAFWRLGAPRFLIGPSGRR